MQPKEEQAKRPRVIRVVDIVRHQVHELGAEEPILRGPYEMFHPVGPASQSGDMVEWTEGELRRNSRVAAAVLGEVRPGERVLVAFGATAPSDDASVVGEDVWWLCEVHSVDGVAAA